MRCRLILSPLLLVAAFLQAQPRSGRPSAKVPGPQKQEPPTPPSFSLDAAKQLSDLHAWEKAEEQYLKLDSNASPSARQQSLDGIKNARQHIIDERRAGALAAARAFEHLDRWKDAEQAYVEVAKTDPGSAREAVANIERIAPKITNVRWPEVIDDWILKCGHVLFVSSILYGVFRFYRAARESRASIKFQPFKASTDDATKQIAFWLESTLANLRSPAAAFPTWPGLASSLPFMRLPEIGDDLELEDLEIGGVKVPLKQLLQSIAVPRARVSGHWYVGTAIGSAYMSVEKRIGLGLHYSSSR